MGVCCGSTNEVKSKTNSNSNTNTNSNSNLNIENYPKRLFMRNDGSNYDLNINLVGKSQVHYIQSNKYSSILIDNSNNSNFAFMDSSDNILIQNTSNCQIIIGPTKK